VAEQPEARHLVQMLRRHYQPENRLPAGIFAPEVGSPDGTRRADAIWMPTTVAGGSGLVGHEVKVSRADLLVELDDPTKADPWAQYCTRWWLVVLAPEMVDGLDIPVAWGVMAPPSGRRTRSMTVVREAPKLTPRDPAPGLARLAAWLLYRTHSAAVQAKSQRGHLERQVKSLQQQLYTAQLAGGSPSRRAQIVAEILRKVEARLGEENVWHLNLDSDSVVAALVDHSATAEAATAVRRELRELVSRVRRVVDPFRHALPDLEKAEKLATDLDGGGGSGG
jgi:hypothetical protein